MQPFTYSRTHVLECSAMDNHNIREIFKSFLKLSKPRPKLNFSFCLTAASQDDSELENPEANLNQLSNKGGLRGNFSAYGGLKSLPKSKSGYLTPATRKDIFEALESGHKRKSKSRDSSPPTSPHPIGDGKVSGFNYPSLGSPKVENNSTDRKDLISYEKPPKRSSRSLWRLLHICLLVVIRWPSQKVKGQMQHVHNHDDCVVS